MHLIRYSTYDNYIPLKTSGDSVIYGELRDVWQYVRKFVDRSESRVMYEELYGIGFLDGGYTNLAALSTHETHVSSIATWGLKTHFSFRKPFLHGYTNPLGSVSQLKELMKRLNCSYVVLWHPGIKKRLIRSGEFDVVYESQNRLFAVMRLKEYIPSWIQFDQEVKAVRQSVFDPWQLTFGFENPVDNNSGLLKMSYHRNWKLSVNGEPIGIVNREGLVSFTGLPAGLLRMTFRFR